MSLYDDFTKLNSVQKSVVHFDLCKNALIIWENFCLVNSPITYVETVVGTEQTVDEKLLNDAIKSAEIGLDLFDVDKRFAEPITALHDDDLVFPDQIEFAYYAVYNLFRKYVLLDKIDDWLIVNQALSAETDINKLKYRLEQALEQTK